MDSGRAAPVTNGGSPSSSLACSGASRDGQSSTGDGVEGEEQEEPSSSHVTNEQPRSEDVLTNLREQCRQELEDTLALYDAKPVCALTEQHSDELIIENTAKNYFLNGIEYEQNGKWYEAIQSYRRAVQLIPDIETRLYEAGSPTQNEYDSCDEDESEKTSLAEDNVDNEFEVGGDLMAHLQKVFSQSFRVCIPNQEQSQTHMSVLPMEIILYILQWVVSSDLDLRALEICSQVCRGFYVCCRDVGIWKLACARIWGTNCGSLTLTNYNSWRQMFIERPRLQFNGCYISKTTYVRHGENSFQDQFYRPWHMVEYYRYLRFFPEGRAFMLTSSDEPQLSVTHLRYRTPRHPSVLMGYYHLVDDRIVVVLQHTNGNNRARTRKREIVPDVGEPTFRINMQIHSTRNHIHGQLIWKGYTITRPRAGQETDTNLDLSSNKYPPFRFSRVKSYTLESETPLQ